jgi:hypothetical protein
MRSPPRWSSSSFSPASATRPALSKGSDRHSFSHWRSRRWTLGADALGRIESLSPVEDATLPSSKLFSSSAASLSPPWSLLLSIAPHKHRRMSLCRFCPKAQSHWLWSSWEDSKQLFSFCCVRGSPSVFSSWIHCSCLPSLSPKLLFIVDSVISQLGVFSASYLHRVKSIKAKSLQGMDSLVERCCLVFKRI